MPQPGARGGADRSVQPHWQWLGGFCHCNGFSTEALENMHKNEVFLCILERGESERERGTLKPEENLS